MSPVNTILRETQGFKGTLAYVGLPDQVASIRKLQRLGHPAVAAIRYVLGPFTGTIMEVGAIQSFLRSHGVKELETVERLAYRAGDWPGRLEVQLRNGRVLTLKKFYYITLQETG